MTPLGIGGGHDMGSKYFVGIRRLKNLLMKNSKTSLTRVSIVAHETFYIYIYTIYKYIEEVTLKQPRHKNQELWYPLSMCNKKEYIHSINVADKILHLSAYNEYEKNPFL